MKSMDLQEYLPKKIRGERTAPVTLHSPTFILHYTARYWYRVILFTNFFCLAQIFEFLFCYFFLSYIGCSFPSWTSFACPRERSRDWERVNDGRQPFIMHLCCRSYSAATSSVAAVDDAVRRRKWGMRIFNMTQLRAIRSCERKFHGNETELREFEHHETIHISEPYLLYMLFLAIEKFNLLELRLAYLYTWRGNAYVVSWNWR